MSDTQSLSGDLNETVLEAKTEESVPKDDKKSETIESNVEDAPQEENGARARIFSHKGRVNNEDKLEKQFNKVKTFTAKIERMIADKEPYEQVRLRHGEWMQHYEQFYEDHNYHYSKLNEGDKEEYMNIHNAREVFLHNFKTKVEEYLNSNANTRMQSDHKPAKSHLSAGSSSLSSKKLENEEKRIELAVRKEALKKKREIEMAKLSLQLKEEELDIETEMAVTDAKSKVYDEFEQGELSEKPVKVKFEMDQNQPETPKPSTSPVPEKSTLNPSVNKFVPLKDKTSPDFSTLPPIKDEYNVSSSMGRPIQPPKTDHLNFQKNFESSIGRPQYPPKPVHQSIENYVDSSVGRSQYPQNLVNRKDTVSYVPSVPADYVTPECDSNMNPETAFQAIIHHLKKPATEIKKFAGNPLEYRKFLRQFHSKVVLNCENDDEKMNYLEQLTIGEANKVVSGYSHLPGERGYKAAMDLLEERYGDTDVMASAFIKKALEWPTIRNGDIKSLDEFALFLIECHNGTESIQAGNILEYSENIKRLMSKLPFHLHDRWRNVVMRIKASHRSVKFKDFVDFVKAEAKKVTDPTYGHSALKEIPVTTHDKLGKQYRQGSHRSASNVSNAVVGAHKVKPQNTLKCTFCDSDTHSLDICRRILSLKRDDRIAHLKSKGLCFGCLKVGHMSNKCQKRLRCDICKRNHPTLLHNDNFTPSRKPVSGSTPEANDPPVSDSTPAKDSVPPTFCSSSTNFSDGSGDVSCAMAIIPVRVNIKNKAHGIETYAFFDSGSNVSFCTEKVMRQLGANGKKTKIQLSTMGKSQTLDTFAISGLQVSGLSMEHTIDLPKVYTKEEMPVKNQHIPTQQEVRKWPHLETINVPNIDSDIGIMIGSNVADAYAPFEIATGPSGSPHATKTRLGWIVWNMLRDYQDTNSVVNRAHLESVHHVHETDNSNLDRLLKHLINMDFPERIIEDKRENSLDDKKFLECMNRTIRFKDNHYSLDLPFRDPDVKLPNNSSQSLLRLKGLKNRLIKNPKLKKDYVDFMDKLLLKGYMEPVPSDQLDRDDGKVWYIPHHGVYHNQNPDKFRIVFDCSATHMGIALNKQLLQGPDLTNNLLGVLLRFRQENVAILGDIEAMFHQVNVPPKDRDCLRFHWWPSGNLDNSPQEFRMTAHLFGATSSPSCCNFALKQTAIDFGDSYDSIVVDTITKNMYVDDCLTSVPSEENGKTLIKDVTSLCKEGGFRMTKWISNKPSVIESIPVDERAKEVREWSLDDNLPVERALGVKWFIETDSLGFNIKIKDKSPTRRSILSIVSSVYDPIGIASPFILSAKSILQTLCKSGIGWDDEIPDSELRKWNNWLLQLNDLEDIKIDRCYKPPNFGKVKECQLHCFADASDNGYGCVFYIRMINSEGKIHCAFVLGKSRVAPLKSVTIPRMELTAATIAVRLSKKIVSELDYEINDIFYWTDSMTVLRYINNSRTRFHTFVANRLVIIHEATKVSQWHYIDTKINPADLASRGTSVSKFRDNQQWFHGPDFLWQDTGKWPVYACNDLRIPSDDSEVTKQVNTVCMAPSDVPKGLDRIIDSFSDWNKLKRIISWFLCVKDRLISTESKQNLSSANIMIRAERSLILYEQAKHFECEISTLEKGDNLKLSSSLVKLNPFIGDDGLLRVGGRLERSDISYDSMHPIILPKDSIISRRILEHIHRSIGHLGKNSILAVARQKFWIIGANGIIKNIVSKCVICRKYQGSLATQKMASLPAERLKADDPPFTRVGIDFFGPFEIKQGRSVVKRYGVIFTCLNIRAVHLELASSLDTDSCINSIRRFIARRGVPKFIRTDNGTNFVGSERELRENIDNWNTDQIQTFMMQQNIQWEFNPPSASHFGGVWERLIRSVRKVLHSVMHEQQVRLTDEGLSTLFCEVESILNGRPLTEISNDVNDLNVLTPNHLLLQRAGGSFPPGVFNKRDNYSKRRWKQIQYLADIFWSRWRKEYLPLLQSRRKWNKVERNIREGDIVMISENAPRNSWNIGRVVEVVKDKDNVIRVAKVKTASSELMRPIAKLCLILENDN